jgi:hypothetical protein
MRIGASGTLSRRMRVLLFGERGVCSQVRCRVLVASGGCKRHRNANAAPGRSFGTSRNRGWATLSLPRWAT